MAVGTLEEIIDDNHAIVSSAVGEWRRVVCVAPVAPCFAPLRVRPPPLCVWVCVGGCAVLGCTLLLGCAVEH